MPRRRSSFDRLLDDLLVFLRDGPWWVGPPCILIAWGLFAWVIPGLCGYFGGEDAAPMVQSVCQPLAVVSAMAAPFMAGFVALLWGMALLRKAVYARRLDRQSGIDSIRALSWREFEQLLAEAFRRQGYRVRETGPGADGGIDLILDKDGRRTIVQAKQWKAWKIGVRTVRELFGVQMAQRADEAILATSGRLTAEARRFAEDNGIRLIEGMQLAEMIASVQRPTRPPVKPAVHQSIAAAPPSIESADAIPRCPKCGAAMVQRTAQRGPHTGESFWGCSTYPACRSTRPAA